MRSVRGAPSTPEQLNFNLEEHHLQAREFADDFQRAGLDIDEYTVDLPTELHNRVIGEGLHTNAGSPEGNWNAAWRRYLDEYPIHGPEDAPRVLQQMEKMIDDFGIADKLNRY